MTRYDCWALGDDGGLGVVVEMARRYGCWKWGLAASLRSPVALPSLSLRSPFALSLRPPFALPSLSLRDDEDDDEDNDEADDEERARTR